MSKSFREERGRQGERKNRQVILARLREREAMAEAEESTSVTRSGVNKAQPFEADRVSAWRTWEATK